VWAFDHEGEEGIPLINDLQKTKGRNKGVLNIGPSEKEKGEKLPGERTVQKL